MSQLIYLVTGASGGAGATTVALELVDRLSKTGQRVLVDADLAGRRSHAVALDMAVALDEQRGPGEPAVAHAHGKELVELTRVYEDGLSLTAVAVDEQRDTFNDDAAFVVDAPQPFAPAVRPYLLRATAIVIVAAPTLLGVAAARGMLLAMRRFGIPGARLALVISDARGVRDLKRSEVEAVLNVRVNAELPPRRDRNWTRAFDTFARGLPATVAEPIVAYNPAAEGEAEGAPFIRGALSAVTRVPSPEARKISARLAHIKLELHEGIMLRINFSLAARAHNDTQKMAELRAQVDDIAAALIAERPDIVGGSEEAAQVRREVVQEAVGLGPIENLLHDPDITEIMVNGCQNVYAERRGLIERTPFRFANDKQVRLVIERIIAPLGRRIDEASPMVDARLADGSRVNAIIEPLAIDGPTLTIRRFGTRVLRMPDLVENNSLTQPIADFLHAAVEARLNVVVSGGTGSGKTTLLNAVSSFIPRSQRIITIEDAAELSLDQPHVVRLESRPANIEGAGAVPIRELVRNALRMRPDRIIVGEARGGEALDMLQAMNTGHDGSLTTIHANTARDALSRIETMVLMAGYDLPIRAIREQISSAVDIVVQVARLRDGTRRLVSLCEVVGMEGDVVTMQEIAHFRQRGMDTKGLVLGAFETTGVQPTCLRRFEEMGIDFDVSSLGARSQEAVWALR